MKARLLVLLVATHLAVPIAAGAVPIDLTILIDGSGSVDASGFQFAKDFVSDLLGVEAPQDGSVAASVILFENGVQTVFDLASITTGSVAGIVQDVQDISYPSGSQSWIRSAVQEAIVQFDANGSPGSDKVMLLVSDGGPSPGSTQSVCSGSPAEAQLFDDLQSRGIRGIVLLLGIGGGTSQVDCLVDDPDAELVEEELFGSQSAEYVGSLIFAAIPEPASLGFLGTALAGALVLRLTRRAG
jgi:hypothetical protein